MDIRVGGSPNKRSDTAVAMMREKRLNEAALCGSVESLHELMREDKLTLARASLTCFNETHLHIAAMLGHADFVEALLSYSSSDLVTKLDEHGRTPMHLASGAGHVKVVRLLVAADADVCLVRDEDGRTPLHLAVMHGHLDVVRELIRARPQVVSTRYMLAGGETILHTCIVHNRLEVLQVLMSMSTTDDDFLNSKDSNGYTILHTSAALKRIEIIRYLVSDECRVRVEAKNESGLTALDMMNQMPRDLKTMEIIDLLVQAGGGSRNRGEINQRQQLDQETRTIKPPKQKPTICQMLKNYWNKEAPTWVEKRREAIMIVATLLAGMAYQASVNPPGGVWQEPKELRMRWNHNNVTVQVVPGTAVMGLYYPTLYKVFWALNTVTYGTTIGIIFLLVSGIPTRRRFCMWILMIFMWVTIMSMALTYVFSLIATMPDTTELGSLPDYVSGPSNVFDSVYAVMAYSLSGWVGLFVLVIMVHLCRIIWRIITIVRRQYWQPKMKNTSVSKSSLDVHQNV